MNGIYTLAVLGHILAAEAEEQASWPREPVTAFRALTGDPRNEVSGGDAGGGDAGAGGESGAGAGGGESGGDGGEGGGSGEVSAADLMAAFDGFRNDVSTRFDGLEARVPEPEEEPEEPEAIPDFFDPRNFDDNDFDENGFLTRDAQQRALAEMVDARVAEALAPHAQQQAEEARVQKANALAEKYPVFADPDKYTPVLRDAQEKAKNLARATGNPALQDLWRDPDFLETTYLAGIGSKAAAAEAAAGGGGNGVTLERGGSAGPGGDGGDGNKELAAGIVAVSKNSKFRLGT